eukprot:751785-Hanusia_phi.AAC.1
MQYIDDRRSNSRVSVVQVLEEVQSQRLLRQRRRFGLIGRSHFLNIAIASGFHWLFPTVAPSPQTGSKAREASERTPALHIEA